MSHYPYGKIFTIDELEEEAQKFNLRDRVPTGLLAGKRVMNSVDIAYSYEEEFDKKIPENGARRFAWIFADEIESEYKEDKNWFELSFTLPKGSYATELISELTHLDLSNT